MKQDNFKIKKNNEDNLYTNNKVNHRPDHFVGGQNTEWHRATSAKTTNKIHNEFSDVFTGIECFKGTFPLKSKTMPYQVPLR